MQTNVIVEKRDFFSKKSERNAINTFIRNEPNCKSTKDDIKKPSEACIDVWRDVVNNRWMNGSDMKALECAIQTIIHTSSGNNDELRETILANLNDSVNEWLKNTKLLTDSGGRIFLILKF